MYFFQCVKVPKEVLKHVPKTVKKKICVSTKAHDHGSYGHSGHGGGYDDQHSFVEVSNFQVFLSIALHEIQSLLIKFLSAKRFIALVNNFIVLHRET